MVRCLSEQRNRATDALTQAENQLEKPLSLAAEGDVLAPQGFRREPARPGREAVSVEL